MNLKSLHRRCLVAILATLGLASCAQQAGSLAAREGGPRAHEGWRYLLAGDASSALKSFDSALASVPEDPFARFGRAAVAFEYGRTEAALDDVKTLLTAAAKPSATPWTRWLASAGTAGWFSTLNYESHSWRQRLDFLAKLPGENLPWPARMELLQVADDTARRAGDAPLATLLAAQAGCPSEVKLMGRVGQRAVLDLLAEVQAFPSPPSYVQLAGCRAQVPPPDALPGVLVVQMSVNATGAGEHDLVLDYPGLAAFRVDGGPWHKHGDVGVWGPSRSASRRRLGPGAHKVELRLSTYGGGAEYWFAAFASSQATAAPPAAPGTQPRDVAVPLAAYAQLLVAGSQGQWNVGLAALDQLRPQRKFALGLVQVGRFAEADPTKPDNVTRDVARGAWRLAIEQDPHLVRARLALSAVEAIEGRAREATAQAQAAQAGAPKWWPAALAAYEALSAEGLELPADQALDAGLKIVGVDVSAKEAAHAGMQSTWACPVIDAAMRRARQREQLALVPILQRLQLGCDARDIGGAMRALQSGDAAAAADRLAQVARLSASPQWLVAEQARALAAAGDVPAAMALTKAYADKWPHDTSFLLGWANLQALAGQGQAARDSLALALNRFPSALEVRQAARALGIALPMETHRQDGLATIAQYMKLNRRYDAPAVFVLDRLVERVFPNGSRMVLTHNIVRVQSKDALDRWGEVNVPAGAEVLTLRTVKPDLSVREPEDIFGKESVSAPELEPGDFVEWETLETLDPSAAFAPGFLGQRFYFQSNEAPLELSEYVVVYPASSSIDYDMRANAPKPVAEVTADGMKVLRFSARQVAQIFPERAAVPALHWLPSVRIASGVSAAGWTGFVADRLSTIARETPSVLATAQLVRQKAGGPTASPKARAAAMVAWVTKNIEAEGSLDEPASHALARGRGNRLGVALALAKALDLAAEPVLVRPLSVEAVDEALISQELMAFSETLLYFPQLSGGPSGKDNHGVFVDLRPRQARFGYVPLDLDGALALRLPGGDPIVAKSQVADLRKVELHIEVAADGKAVVSGKETLVGGPAVEWTEALFQIGPDIDKRRRRFEESYLSYHFPGAELANINFDVQADVVHLDYKLTVERFATLTKAGLVIEPRFYLSQPGRRFSTESRRTTTLLMGPDVPLELTARIEGPAGYRIADASHDLVLEPLGASGPRFVERRTIEAQGLNKPARMVIQRSHHVPLLRVPPQDYARFSAELRRVDVVEQALIRMLRAPGPAAAIPLSLQP